MYKVQKVGKKMSLKIKLNSEEFNGLNESLKALYVEKDGSYILDVEDSGLKTAFNKQKEKIDDLAGQIAVLKSQGSSNNDQEIARLQNDLKIALEKDSSYEDKYKSKLTEIETLNKTLMEERTQSTVSLANYKLQNSLKSALIGSGADNDETSLQFLQNVISGKVEFDSETNAHIFKNKDGDSQKRDDKGNWIPLTAEDVVKELIDSSKYDKFFNKSVSRGFNTSGSHNARQQTRHNQLTAEIDNAKTSEEKIRLMAKRDGL